MQMADRIYCATLRVVPTGATSSVVRRVARDNPLQCDTLKPGGEMRFQHVPAVLPYRRQQPHLFQAGLGSRSPLAFAAKSVSKDLRSAGESTPPFACDRNLRQRSPTSNRDDT